MEIVFHVSENAVCLLAKYIQYFCCGIVVCLSYVQDAWLLKFSMF